MSLDFYLEGKEEEYNCCSCGQKAKRKEELAHFNITHNLGKMALRAGIYTHLWRPEELEISVAKDLIDPLKKGLKKLKDDPEHFSKFNSDNGWGTYGHFLEFVKDVLEACEEFPNAKINVCR